MKDDMKEDKGMKKSTMVWIVIILVVIIVGSFVLMNSGKKEAQGTNGTPEGTVSASTGTGSGENTDLQTSGDTFSEIDSAINSLG